ncbi:MAG: 50S ribosomal protein L11 methyltransferase [Pigmentiphaga sp.]
MRELLFDCDHERAEAWSDALLEAGALSVSVNDADDGTEAERPLYGEPGLEPETLAWRHNRLVVLLPEEADAAELLTAAGALAGLPAPAAFEVRAVPDTDWVRLTQSQFDPIPVGERLWIVPSWHDVPQVGDDAVVIRLDPGLAFGTGSHPTTHLCLEWLAQNPAPGADVLDYGCGSGILAIAARKLGAGRVVGVDIDPQAVQSTLDNAEANQVELHACLPDALPEGRYPVVVANILSNPLKVLAPMLCERVAPGGQLALSGVLERQADEVAAAYAPWLAMSVWQARDGWVCLHGRKPESP